MGYAIGTLTKGGGEDTHRQFVRLVRHMCGGFGDLGTIGGSRTGNGTLTSLEASPSSVTETWTLTCTAAAANGGTFSVVGSVSGAQASATVGTAYSNTFLSFTIVDGTTDFIVGDKFIIPVTQGQLSAQSRAWAIMRFTTGANMELIMCAPGLSGTEQIYVGLYTYESVPGDYYNLGVSTMTGYVPGNTYLSQPGIITYGVPAHNNSITYYLTVNGQRAAFMLKVGTPVYTHAYIGKFFPYARPSEYPYPVVCAGILSGMTGVRFSNLGNYFPYHGNISGGVSFLSLRKPDGAWLLPFVWPYSHGNQIGDSLSNLPGGTQSTQVPANGQYQLESLIMGDPTGQLLLTNNLWGELDGVYFISGYNNTVENIVQVGGSSVVNQNSLTPLQAVQAIKAVNGRAFVVGQNVHRTGWRDYVAIEM